MFEPVSTTISDKRLLLKLVTAMALPLVLMCTSPAATSGSIIGLSSESGVDLDGDGYHDGIVVTVDLEFVAPGAYRLAGDLWAVGDNDTIHVASAHKASYCLRGSTSFSMGFDGGAIQRTGGGGIYLLALQLYRYSDKLEGTQFVTVDSARFPLSAQYDYSQFRPIDMDLWRSHDTSDSEPVSCGRLTAEYSDGGIDIDGDGRYDRLLVDVGIEAEVAGSYTVTGLLESSDGHVITNSKGMCYTLPVVGDGVVCPPGRANVRLEFSGQGIYDRGIDGRYVLKADLVGRSACRQVTQEYVLSSYDHTLFRETAGETVGVEDSAVDTDKDGFYDSLQVRLSIVVARAGRFTLRVSLMKDSTEIASVSDYGRFEKGDVVKSVSLDGTAVRNSKLNGPYTIRVDLKGEHDCQSDRRTFETAVYNCGDFAP